MQVEFRSGGVFATTSFAAKHVIEVESPLAFRQNPLTKTFGTSCATCARFIDSRHKLLANYFDIAEAQGRRSEGTTRARALALQFQGPSPGIQPPVRCAGGKNCDELYCSDGCRTQAVKDGHYLLCVGTFPSLRTLKDFLDEVYDGFAVSALLLAKWALELSGSGVVAESATQHPLGFLREAGAAPLWTLHSDLDEERRRLLLRGHELLREAFSLNEGGHSLASVLETPHLLSQLLNICETCCVDVKLKSPVPEILSEIHGRLREVEGCPEESRILASAVKAQEADEVDDDESSSSGWPVVIDYHGTGLYRLAASMNHSCEPNVEMIIGEKGDNRITYRSLRPICKGDELRISYISDDEDIANMDFSERRDRLEELNIYRCQCSRCETDRRSMQDD